jgi:hypothetical protein
MDAIFYSGFANMELETEVIDFGSFEKGKIKTSIFRISNTGTMGVVFRIYPPGPTEQLMFSLYVLQYFLSIERLKAISGR